MLVINRISQNLHRTRTSLVTVKEDIFTNMERKKTTMNFVVLD